MKKTANISRAVKRFYAENEQIGVTIVPNNIKQVNHLKHQYYLIKTSITVFCCPPGLHWSVVPLSKCNINCPFLLLYPFNCDRIDGFNMNSKLSYDWSWGSLEFPTSDLQLNYTHVHNSSASWVYLQHLQILMDLFEEIAACNDKSTIEDISDRISLVETSLSNFKTTKHFYSMPLWENEADYIEQLLLHAVDIKKLKKFIQESHPLQFVHSMISLFENDVQTYNYFFGAADMIQLFYFANNRNESSTCVKVNLMKIFKHVVYTSSITDVVSGLLSIAENCVIREIYTYFIKFMMVKQVRRVSRAGSKQIQSNVNKIKLMCQAAEGKIMPILCRMHKFHPENVANVIASFLSYGDIDLRDFESNESIFLFDRYRKLVDC
tara:strand:+ start:2815 stop:3951 length:1137 start_codon:yes stop_codon:yes gene_type:complete